MRTVLIVDDQIDTIGLVVEELRLNGWRATGTRTAEEALQLASSLRFDVVVADLFLPGIDGESLELAFRQDSALAQIPFVFITGFGPAAQRLGPGRVLLKPFSTSELLAEMERAVATAEAPTWTQGPRAEADDPHLN